MLGIKPSGWIASMTTSPHSSNVTAMLCWPTDDQATLVYEALWGDPIWRLGYLPQPWRRNAPYRIHQAQSAA
jgi:hypothetical protein